VQHALGLAGGARRVHRDEDRGGIDRGQGALVHRSAGGHLIPGQGARIAHDDYVAQLGQLGAQALDHRRMVALAEGAGHEDRLGAAVAEDEFQLGLAVDRRDRVDDKAAHPRGKTDHRRFRPVGKLEGDDVSRLKPARQEPAREPQRGLPHLAPGNALLALDLEQGIGVLGHARARRIDQRFIAPVPLGKPAPCQFLAPAHFEAARIGPGDPFHRHFPSSATAAVRGRGRR
jgi:hypothetical protein